MTSEDRCELRVTPTVERLTAPFEIESGVTLPARSYAFDRFAFEIETADKRPVGAHATFETGSYDSGTLDAYQAALVFRPVPGLSIEPEYERNEGRLAEGNFTTNLARLRLKIDFSPDVSLNVFAQYDDVSNSLGINSRFRWIIEPGSEMFFVVNQGFRARDPITDRFVLQPTTNEIAVKVGYTFRF